MEYGNAHTMHLASGWGKDLSKYAQLVFGELAKLAIPVLRYYHGDLYHDALWVSNHIAGMEPLTFYYGVRETGTNIGWFEETMTDGGNTEIYRCRVHMIDYETCEMTVEKATNG